MSQAIFKSDLGGMSIASSEAVPLDRSSLLKTTGVRLALVKIALSAVAWFLAVAWLDFSGGPHVDLVLAIVTGFFVMFFTLLLVASSMAISDPRWKTAEGTVYRIEGVKCGARLNIDARIDSSPYAATNHVSPEAKPQ